MAAAKERRPPRDATEALQRITLALEAIAIELGRARVDRERGPLAEQLAGATIADLLRSMGGMR